jgi:hypothetical protein
MHSGLHRLNSTKSFRQNPSERWHFQSLKFPSDCVKLDIEVELLIHVLENHELEHFKNENTELEHKNYIFVSDDLGHNIGSVYAILQKLMPEIKNHVRNLEDKIHLNDGISSH